MLRRYEAYMQDRHGEGYADRPAKWCKPRLVKPCYLDRWPYQDSSIIELPGYGHLRVEIHPDENYDLYDSDGQKFAERDIAEEKQVCGQYLGDGWWVVGRAWNGEYQCVTFTAGGELEERVKWWRKAGMARGPAYAKAFASCQHECEYWKDVLDSNISAVGVVVQLYREGRAEEVAEESCWGYAIRDTHEHRDRDCAYILDEINAKAHSLIEDNLKGFVCTRS
jgi:hypothetical protein